LAPGGRAYLVERGLDHDGVAALRALAVEDVRHAELLDAIPMIEPML
jgi:hypothetical protein